MRVTGITTGVLALFVGLGFVCPQIAAARIESSLTTGGCLLLLGGLLLMGGGAWCVARGIRGTGTVRP